MKLLERARLLKALGLLPANADLSAIVSKAEAGDIDVEMAPATALLVAGGVVLTIAAEELTAARDIPAVVRRFESFCGNVFKVSDVQVRSLGVSQHDASDYVNEDDLEEGEELPATFEEEAIEVRITIDGTTYESEVTRLDDMIDLGFVTELQDHLESIGEKRQICQLVEDVDDDPRFLFVEPEKMEEAELREIITAPDFEEEDD